MEKLQSALLHVQVSQLSIRAVYVVQVLKYVSIDAGLILSHIKSWNMKRKALKFKNKFTSSIWIFCCLVYEKPR